MFAFGAATPVFAADEEVEIVLHKRVLRDVDEVDFEDFENNGLEIPAEKG